VWKLWLTKEEADKIEAKTDRYYDQTRLLQPAAVLDVEREAIERAYELVTDYDFLELELDQFCLSHKVTKLIEHLKEHFDPEKDKCIIFADQRLTVALLADLFTQPSLSLQGYRAGRLVSV
jgi:endoribonuclease Dicer